MSASPHQLRAFNDEVLAAAELHFVHREQALAVQCAAIDTEIDGEQRSIDLWSPRIRSDRRADVPVCSLRSSRPPLSAPTA